MAETRDKVIFFALTIGSVVALAARRIDQRLYTYTALVDPASVADIAASLPANEEDFIIAAWEYVATHVQYENFGTMLYFTDQGVECDSCFSPVEILAEGESNCVGKSVLLTSILRNRIPADRVYMAVGTLNLNSNGGHAWVRVKHDGVWYALEPTLMPPAQPWIPEDSVAYKYTSEGYMNDQSYYCSEPGLCLAIKKTSCLPYVS